ncbi:3'-5' exoribonuclease [Carboxylicivirga mesophila]|uniref:3'-5' exoribonuclease n=1 Tax=Carboxylicivirga mesophila TaxID=1166478 RepID=A0ABS5KEN9_9BACT|nr:BRCT domain-containing protein [Carboxylicivirga mesophila]MBS2213460.1 3'-5' exoribonuclease [Carboxylicivirga mesophila]
MNELFQTKQTDKVSKLEIAAIQLAISFSEEKDIPSNYKKSSKRTQKVNIDTQIQIRFKKNVKKWKNTISKMLEHIKSEQAWRFINLKPLLITNLESVTQHPDFIEFTDYFVLRRDTQSCDHDELGCLAELHTAFQKEIEKKINLNKPDFVSIDFEHASRHKGSVCSVGIVSFKDGKILDEYYSLVKPPQNKYEWFTTNKHKLDASHTEKSPEFTEVYSEIKKRIENNIVVAHGAFHTDKHCLEQAMELSNINEDLKLLWVCTQDICNSKLDVACKVCQIELDHHQALSDAKACGFLYELYRKNELPYDLIQFEKTHEQSIKENKSQFPKSLKGDVLKPDFENAKNKDNPFYMKKVVVSGFGNKEKESLAAELKELGADVDTSVGKKTNYLIIGENAGPSKLKKMQLNINEGKEAFIITFAEFNEMKKQHIANNPRLA